MRWALVAAPGALLAAAAVFVIAPAGAQTSGTIYACIGSGRLTHVNVSSPQPCPSQTPVSWPGNVPDSPSPSPTATTASPSPSPTATTASPSPSPTATGASCTATLGNNCGPFSYAGIPMSNGFDTYVGPQNVGSNSGTTATVTAADPGDWSAKADAQPYGYGGVQIFANAQQLTNDWCGSGWGGCANMTDTPLAALSALSISYSETTPRDSSVSAEFAPDIWQDNYPSDIMFWADTQGRCNDGAYGSTVLGTASFGGQTWTVNRYGGPGAEIIFVLDSDPGTPNSCAQQASGTIDVKAGLDWLTAHGILTSPVVLSQVNTGWEITSADHGAFTVNSYSITATPS